MPPRTPNPSGRARSGRIRRGALAALFLFAACATVPPSPEDWLAVGDRSPEQAFKTYQTALAGNRVDLEYRAFSSDFKRRNDFNQVTYRIFREELLREQPWLKLASRAEVVASTPLGPDRHRLTVHVDAFLVDVTAEVTLVREDFLQLYDGDRRVLDRLVPFDEVVLRDEQDPGLAWVLVQPPEELAGQPFTEVRVGRKWKIDGLEVLPDESPVSQRGDSPWQANRP